MDDKTITLTYYVEDFDFWNTLELTSDNNLEMLFDLAWTLPIERITRVKLSGNGYGSAYGALGPFFNAKQIDVSELNTTHVTEMTSMFGWCEQVEELDLSNFDLSNVRYASDMFVECTNLKTIYCNDDWSTLGIDGEDMFDQCNSLVGAVPYDSSQTGITMANPTTGYFTRKGGPTPTTTNMNFNGTEIKEAYFNGTKLEHIYFNGEQLL